MCVCIHGDGDLNNLHIQFDTVICFFIRSLYHIIKYHLDDFIASDIWGYLADGRGMINELQENIATNRKFGTHTWYERIEYAHVTPNTFFPFSCIANGHSRDVCNWRCHNANILDTSHTHDGRPRFALTSASIPTGFGFIVRVFVLMNIL